MPTMPTMPRRPLELALLCLTLVGAFLVKRHYSDAPVDELGYVLRPTAALVELVTGTTFTHEAREGYLSRATHFVIAKPCAGVNFWIVAACASVFAFVPTRRTAIGQLLLWAGCVGGAFVATLVTNTVRIAIAIELHTQVGAIGPLSPDRVHQLEGMLVYTLSLCLLFLAARRLLSRPAPEAA